MEKNACEWAAVLSLFRNLLSLFVSSREFSSLSEGLCSEAGHHKADFHVMQVYRLFSFYHLAVSLLHGLESFQWKADSNSRG